VDEICDECIVKDENDVIVQFNLRGSYTKEVKDTIEKEYKKFIEIFDLEDKGWEYFRQFLIDGELYFENIILEDKRDLGIIGLVSIPTELINPVYQNVQNELVKGFLIRKPVVGPATSMNRKDQEELFFMNKAQVTYIQSGIWNEFKSIRLPFIENAKRAYRQLSLVEDSIVIYRLVRAPERLRFTIYTGSMPPPKAEAYLKRLMQSYWTKKNFDCSQGSGGRVTNIYDPQSMLDAYWFTKDAQGNGSTVDSLPGGQNLGEIEDVEYFLNKLYRGLKIPKSRFGEENRFSIGDTNSEISREEMKFMKEVKRFTKRFANALKQIFLMHLKLKGISQEYGIDKQDILLKINENNLFNRFWEAKILELKFQNFEKFADKIDTDKPLFAKEMVVKKYLEWSDEEYQENEELLAAEDAAKQAAGGEEEGGDTGGDTGGDAGGEDSGGGGLF
jgi:hypothetical protein